MGSWMLHGGHNGWRDNDGDIGETDKKINHGMDPFARLGSKRAAICIGFFC
jgi:hypothetical protein